MEPIRWKALCALATLLALVGCSGGDGGGGTTPECQTDAQCNDSNACTTDVCRDNACVHEAVAVDDHNACTVDSCSPATGVQHTPVNVDDKDACTTDSCDAATGKVSHAPVDVDDHNACTTDACDSATGVSHTPISTDDGDACTTDACDPSTGGITHDAVSVDDHNVCTTDACDSATGVSHTPVSTDDGNACTTDTCDPSTGIKHAPVSADDGDACTTDTCDPSTGVSHTAVSTDDHNVCTRDSCDPATGVKHVDISVDDSNLCTLDSCDPTTGVKHVDISVDDGNACTTDSCNPTTGVKHESVPVDDRDACTTDSCDPATGGITHDAVSVDDGNVCTTDSCEATTGIHHDPVSIDDSIACTDDACDPKTGVSHTPVNTRCEKDGFSCTVAVCSPTTGCSESADNARCSDGVGCTTDACVGAGGAAGTGCANTTHDSLCQALQVCRAGGCTAAISGDQVGNIVITEFSALGSELIELHNTSALAVDIHGFVFQNLAGQLADIRATTDVSGSAGTAVSIPAGGYAYGVPNPSSGGSIPAGAAFVYGDVDTSFSLNDTGDVISIHSRDGATLQDFVDFRGFITDANAQMTANAFPGFLGVTTQVDPSSASATGNDSGANWCTTFYPAAPAAKKKVSNTAGAANGNCKVAVINEALIDPLSTDDGSGFVELTGPGGALVGGSKLEDVEGKGTSAGTRNAGGTGDINGTDPGGELTLPAGWRIPADGVLIIADGVNGTTSGTFTATKVAGLGAGDLTVRDMDLENSGGDSIILVGSDGIVWDAVGHEGTGANLDVNATTFKINNLALQMYETATAITPSDTVGYSLCRDTLSTDSDNNRNDFHTCLTPSPGSANSMGLATTITSISPNTTLASSTATTANVVITGTELGSGATVKFGAATATCTANSPTQLTCTAPANATVGRVDVSVTNTLRAGSGTATATNAFTYTGVLNGTSNPLQADYCNLQYPASFTVNVSTATPVIYGQLYEAGLTEADGAPAGVMAQMGYGPSASNPTSVTTWRYFDAAYNVQVGNNDEYMASFTAPAIAGTYSYAYRFSLDNGLNWTYCDTDGAGASLGFSTTALGTMTVQ